MDNHHLFLRRFTFNQLLSSPKVAKNEPNNCPQTFIWHFIGDNNNCYQAIPLVLPPEEAEIHIDFHQPHLRQNLFFSYMNYISSPLALPSSSMVFSVVFNKMDLLQSKHLKCIRAEGSFDRVFFGYTSFPCSRTSVIASYQIHSRKIITHEPSQIRR